MSIPREPANGGELQALRLALTEREAQVRELQERLDDIRENRARLASAGARLTLRVAAGARVEAAVRRVWKAWWDYLEGPRTGKWPKDETGDLLAAGVARLLRVVGVATLIALLPTLILVVQTWIIGRQTQALNRQNSLLAFEQTSKLRDLLFQPADTSPTGREHWPAPNQSVVEQIASFGASEPEVPRALRPLLFDASGSVASGALLALLRIESGTEPVPTLRRRMVAERANFCGATFDGVRLSRLDLRQPCFSGSRWVDATIESTRVWGGNFGGTFMRSVVFLQDTLTDVSMAGDTLLSIQMDSSKLHNVDLTGAYVNGFHAAQTEISRVVLDNALLTGRIGMSATEVSAIGLRVVDAMLEPDPPEYTTLSGILVAPLFDNVAFSQPDESHQWTQEALDSVDAWREKGDTADLDRRALNLLAERGRRDLEMISQRLQGSRFSGLKIVGGRIMRSQSLSALDEACITSATVIDDTSFVMAYRRERRGRVTRTCMHDDLFPPIQFESQTSFALSAGETRKLDLIAAVLRGVHEVHLLVRGSTGASGSKVTNREVSRAYVTTVISYLGRRGVNASRLVPHPVGEEGVGANTVEFFVTRGAERLWPFAVVTAGGGRISRPQRQP